MLYKKTGMSKFKKYISYLVIFSQLSSIAIAAPNINTGNRSLQKNSDTSVNKFMPAFSNAQESVPLDKLNFTNNSFNLISPLNWGVTYSDLTGTFVNAQYVHSLGDSFAFGVLGEYGASQYRFNGTLGYELSSFAQIKFSAERLEQKLPFQFEFEKTNYRVHQDAYGVRLENVLNNPFLHDLNLGGYYAQANNKRFAGVAYISDGMNCNGFEAGLNCINYRNLAGATSSGADIGTKFLLSSKTLINTNIYYDTVRYNTIFSNTPNHNRQGLGLGVRLNQLLTEQFKLSGEATAREIYNTYQAGLNWRPTFLKMPIEVSLIGQHITSRNATPDNNSITLQFSLLTHSNQYETKYSQGNRILHNITQWVKDPAVKMQQVLVISEEINKLLAPQIFNITPASGPLSGGNLVTIRGSNFAPGVLVFVAGQLIANIQQNQSTLTFTMPAFNGNENKTVDIVVQNRDGQKSTLLYGYTYLDVPPPSAPTATINATGTLITGTAQPGTTITATSNGLQLGTTITDMNGNYSLPLNPAQTNGQLIAVTASLSGLVSLPTTITAPNIQTPTITINPVAGDNTINAAEAAAGIVVTGITTGTEAGNVVSLTVNGITYSGTVVADGSWSIALSPADLAVLPQGTVPFTASVTNAAGNIATASVNVTVETISVPTITINPVAGDNVINAADVAAGVVVTGTTTSIPAGNTVTLTVGGTTYSATVQADGSWSITLPAADLATLPQGIIPFTATVTDAAGNAATTSVNVTVDTTPPTITINPVAGDNTINAAEAAAGIVVTGTTNAGNVVSLTVDGITYPATVQADGSWSVPLSSTVLLALPQGSVPFTATVVNVAGNTSTISVDVTVDTTAPIITIDPVAGDNIINAAEAAAGIVVTGMTGTGNMVSLTVDGITYPATVQADGSWSVPLSSTVLLALPQGSVPFTATVVNAAGNTSTISVDVTVDTTAPIITIDPVTGDNIINAAEAAAGIVVTGTTTADAGNVVSLTVDGITYPATVQTDGSWSVPLSSTVLLALPQGSVLFTATVTDAAGNAATTSVNVTVDTSPPNITIDPVTGDNIINAAEAAAGIVVTGTTDAGNMVSLTVDGITYPATVQADGSWSAPLSSIVLSTLPQGSVPFTATVVNAAGNTTTISVDVTVATLPPNIVINTVADDDVINASEAAVGVSVTGTTTATPGETVILTVGPGNYLATVDASGNWSIFLSSAVLMALPDGTITFTASVTDVAGNVGSTSRDVVIDINP
ncbi:Ig-like domain-containing protein [Legionella lytica]|uniref:Ig-like domain-containing protein n=1 Tax=Legionella lytica TaxID=96232 RepID=A0ABW8D8J2_9GAMM